MSARFRIFFAPASPGVDKKVSTTKYFNKPFGVRYWLEDHPDFHLDGATGKMIAKEKSFVFIIDPDQLFLRQLSTDFTSPHVEFWSPFAKQIERKKRVESGVPFGQTYGLGKNWLKFTDQAGENSPAKSIDDKEAQLHYQVGPPYIAEVSDMYTIVKRWSELVSKVHAAKPQLLAEMYAYQLAASDVQLPHEVVNTMMVSGVDAYGEGEGPISFRVLRPLLTAHSRVSPLAGWALIDKIPDEDVCDSWIKQKGKGHVLPTFLHFCQSYGIQDVFFSKYMIPQDIFSCSKPLMLEPTANVMAKESAYKLNTGRRRENLEAKFQKRHAFVTCAMTSAINEASLFFKKHHCGGDANIKQGLDLLN